MAFLKSKEKNSHNLSLDIPCSVPTTMHCAMGLFLDKEKQEERIVIGEMEDIAGYLQGNVHAPQKLLVNEVRPFGTMIEELFESCSIDIVDAATGFRPNTINTRPDLLFKGVEVVERLYASDNLVRRFVGLRLWQEYQAVKSLPETAEINDRLDSIIYPVRFSHRKQIELWQNVYTSTGLYEFLKYPYFEFPAYAMYQNSRPMNVWHVTDFSVLPLYVHYLNTVYTKQEYFQCCKRCGKLYVAHTAKTGGFCSEDCRKAQQKENRKRYSEKVEGDEAEKAYRATYMYWYNRMKKIRQSPNIDHRQRDELETAFKAFCTEGVRFKNDVQNGKKTKGDFLSWLLNQRIYFDRLTEDVIK